jgi:hypothetical protein
MSAPRGKRTSGGNEVPPPPRAADDEEASFRTEPGGRVPDLLRRVIGLGFSGFFLTEEVVRKALGDSVPREWVDFAAQQSERTRRELIDRVAGEVGRALDGTDLPQLVERLLRGHTLEVTARVRFVPREEGSERSAAAPIAGALRVRTPKNETEL